MNSFLLNLIKQYSFALLWKRAFEWGREQGARDFPYNAVQSEMHDYVLNAKAAGFEKIVDEKNLTIIPVHAEHDSMMSQSSLDEMNVTQYMG